MPARARNMSKARFSIAELVRKALDDVAEVYHLAALPGMWTPCKDDFHAVNCRGTEIVLEAARERGVSRFLHCSTESILFGAPPGKSFAIEHIPTVPDEMPGVYTRSKLLAEQRALQAAASGFPVVIANPTMPIGPPLWKSHAADPDATVFSQPPHSVLLRFRVEPG